VKKIQHILGLEKRNNDKKSINTLHSNSQGALINKQLKELFDFYKELYTDNK